MVAGFYLLPRHAGRYNLGDLQNFVEYLGIAGLVALLLAPNIAFHFGAGFSNFSTLMIGRRLKKKSPCAPSKK